MESHLLSRSVPLPSIVLEQLACGGALPEISNIPGAVRWRIFRDGLRDPADGKLRRSLLFVIYQTGRHGPENGFRLVLVRQGFVIKAAVKKRGEEEDEIHRLGRTVFEGCVEVVVLGPELKSDPED